MELVRLLVHALTFGHEKQLIMEPVPVHGRPAFTGGYLEQHAADTVLGQGAVFVDADGEWPDAEDVGRIFFVEFNVDWAVERHFYFSLEFFLFSTWILATGLLRSGRVSS